MGWLLDRLGRRITRMLVGRYMAMIEELTMKRPKCG